MIPACAHERHGAVRVRGDFEACDDCGEAWPLTDKGEGIMATHSRIYREWVRRIESGVFSKGQCQQWAAVVYPLSESIEPRGKRTNLKDWEARELCQMLWDRGGVSITADHSAQGVAWMQSKRVRDTFPAWALEEFEKFSYQGDAADIGHGGWPQYIPVWRVHARDGRWLDYYNGSWQSQEPGARVVGSSERVAR